jgi:hypothetical protein
MFAETVTTCQQTLALYSNLTLILNNFAYVGICTVNPFLHLDLWTRSESIGLVMCETKQTFGRNR